MRTGNVIRNPHGDLEIVVDVHEYNDPKRPDVVETIAFDAENVSGVHRLEDYKTEETCLCGDHPDFEGEPQEDCEDCHGTGHYTRKWWGWKHSKVLAPNVKAFIMKRLLKNFDLD